MWPELPPSVRRKAILTMLPMKRIYSTRVRKRIAEDLAPLAKRPATPNTKKKREARIDNPSLEPGHRSLN